MAGTKSRRSFWRCECWQAALAIVLLLLILQATGCAGFPVSASNANPSAEPFAIATSSLPSGATGSAYSASLSASGGRAPYTWTVSAGQLPPGLSISTNAGEISGNPTESSEWTFTLQAADSSSPAQIATKSLTILVSKTASPLQITTTSLAEGQVGSLYMANVAASGGTAPYSWSITEGELPIGLTLDGARGELLGTPTQSGAFSTTLQVTDSSSPKQTATTILALVIVASPASLQITTSSLPDAQQGAMYSATLTASGGTTPYTWSMTEGSLPTGLVLNETTGQINGTPMEDGSFTITVEVRDSSSPVKVASASLDQSVNGPDSQDCPTGQPCGATAPYCESYAPPSTSGAHLITSLPYNVTEAGNYYLDSDLTSRGNGIYITYQGGSPIDINLNGHTITYGTVPNGSGPTAIGEYGILDCAESTVTRLDSSYATNGYCAAGPVAPRNVTVENGTIAQSPHASEYYDPNNCPGSGVGSGTIGPCSSHHETVMSDVIKIQNTSNVTLRHLSLSWQNGDSNGMALDYEGSGFNIECNRFDDEVTQINNRAYQEGAAINMALASPGQALTTIKYNTMVGSPQSIINLDTGRVPADIEYNDMNGGYYQAPPYSAQAKGYSNDYAIYCPNGSGSAVAYNYIHSVNGRGIGCLYDGDTRGLPVHDNYVNTAELAGNAEYGPNGGENGGAWVGKCEIDGGRGWEAKGTASVQLFSNVFIVNVGSCGGAGIVFTDYVSPDCAGCPRTADAPFNVHDNAITILNTGGGSTLEVQTQATCYLFDHSTGRYSNFFTAFLRENCMTDGDFVATDGYSPGDYFSFDSPTWARGTHPLSVCGQDASSCGYMMHWQGVSTPPTDELGFMFQDVSIGAGASLGVRGEHIGGSPLARSATVQWTYTVTAQNASGSVISGATVTATDAGGQRSSCTTNLSGSCSLELRQQVMSSAAGNAILTTRNENPNTLAIAAPSCTTFAYNLSIAGTTSETRTLTCQ